MSVLTSFNIRLLQVYAALCLSQFCAHFSIKHPSIDQLILHLMKMITATDLPGWEQEGTFLAITGRGDPLPEDITLLVTSPDRLQKFNALVENCVEVGIIDMYGASTDQPLNFLQKAMEILYSSNVPLPSPDRLISYNNGADAWGEPVSDLELKEILNAYGVDVKF